MSRSIDTSRTYLWWKDLGKHWKVMERSAAVSRGESVTTKQLVASSRTGTDTYIRSPR